jgi:hypothetical protein
VTEVVDTDKLAKAIAEAAEEYERQYGRLPSKAKVTLSKSDTGPPDPRDMSEGYAISTRHLARAEVIRRHAGNLVLAERAEARLGELRKADPMTSYEQAVAVVLNEDPDLYEP